ncbi:hypothetical protein RHO13_01935 [Orbus wheelerorum]|uniref:hypothetical protein n=1 Tax=Orbus wheelerorum TaxID=3074111 RepID=UPI00370D91C0
MKEIFAQILINDLKLRIKELESDKHVNEIKANYLEWIIKTIEDKHKSIDPMGLYEPAIDLKTLKGEIKKLRGNDE